MSKTRWEISRATATIFDKILSEALIFVSMRDLFIWTTKDTIFKGGISSFTASTVLAAAISKSELVWLRIILDEGTTINGKVSLEAEGADIITRFTNLGSVGMSGDQK